jgi:hypothetical protein
MRNKKFRAIAIKSFALLVVLGTAYQAMAQDAKPTYPSMAPIEQYLMTDRDAEIALARSAAPESISGDAEVLVLGRHGFETAVKGKTVSCVSWSVRGLPQLMLTFGIRKCGPRYVGTQQPHAPSLSATLRGPT